MIQIEVRPHARSILLSLNTVSDSLKSFHQKNPQMCYENHKKLDYFYHGIYLYHVTISTETIEWNDQSISELTANTGPNWHIIVAMCSETFDHTFQMNLISNYCPENKYFKSNNSGGSRIYQTVWGYRP